MSPTAALSVVVLPAPLRPMKAWISPGRTSRERSETAVFPPL